MGSGQVRCNPFKVTFIGGAVAAEVRRTFPTPGGLWKLGARRVVRVSSRRDACARWNGRRERTSPSRLTRKSIVRRVERIHRDGTGEVRLQARHRRPGAVRQDEGAFGNGRVFSGEAHQDRGGGNSLHGGSFHSIPDWRHAGDGRTERSIWRRGIGPDRTGLEDDSDIDL